jgi:hypothetical protein
MLQTAEVGMTEVGVQTGRATVNDAAGDPLEILHPGEYMTVRADGRHRKVPVKPVEPKFSLDLTQPLPDGWAVGKLKPDPRTGSQVLVPEYYFDPYHRAHMYQVRSDHRWYQGFARLLPGSRFRVRFKVEKAGRSQVVACVRKDDLGQSDTGVLECNGAFANARPGVWEEFEARSQSMRDDKGNKHAPNFGPPWVAFLLIVNTYEKDLGLEIASFEVVPP